MLPSERSRRSVGEWSGREIRPGESCDVELAIGESYSGVTIGTPIHIHRAIDPGPVVFVTGALHGDEINGTGAVRRLIQDKKFRLQRGSLILVPVLNLPAFERHSRYLPDRRDLNRCFPGSATGSLAGRMAHAIFDEIVSRCDYGIDLHTAAVRRTNYPNVRADMKNREVQLLAKAFGCGREVPTPTLDECHVELRVCIVGLARQHVGEAGTGLVGATCGEQQRPELELGPRVAGCRRDGAAEHVLRLLRHAPYREQVAEVVERLRVSRGRGNRAAQDHLGLLGPARRGQRDAEIDQGVGAGAVVDGASQERNGLCRVPAP